MQRLVKTRNPIVRDAVSAMMASGDPPRYDSCVVMLTKTRADGRTVTEYHTRGNEYAWQGSCAHFYTEHCAPFSLVDEDDVEEGEGDGG